jgi:heterodisulfide reductase subunit A
LEEFLAQGASLTKLCQGIRYDNFGDVMIVGGGISGIQAALDLATAGFRVYMVEKAPAIGGHMAQLDKTYPTNDCSM